MVKSTLLLLALLVACCAVVGTVGGYADEYEGEWERQLAGGSGGNGKFLLQESMNVVKTDAGEMRVMTGDPHRFWRNPMHMGLINMEPNSLFVPQYLDSNLILFIRSGEARIGHIHNGELVQRTLRAGDLYRIESGSAFYIVNNAESRRLHMICSIHTSDNYGWQWNRQGFQSFFVGGGTNPTSVLSGFDPITMSAAFNVSMDECREIMTRQNSGPIVYLSDSRVSSIWSTFLNLKLHQKLAHLKRIVRMEEDDMKQDEAQPAWSLRKLLMSFLGEEDRRGDDRRGTNPDAYNIYERKSDFRNDYGWTKAVSENDYSPLRHSDISVYHVKLSAGSMLAPHINPRATEYGVIFRGSGNIQIVYPNGTLAMNARVSEGDAFWVPRYFPFCQIASKSGHFEFFGFSTSARNNRPQFLAGANSLLQNLAGPEFAAAFGVSEERLQKMVNAQRESTILPSTNVAPQDSELNVDKTERALITAIRMSLHDKITGLN